MHYLHSCTPPVLHRDLKVLLVLDAFFQLECHWSIKHKTSIKISIHKSISISIFFLLQPGNLLLDASNTLRITDFGLATLRQKPSPAIAADEHSPTSSETASSTPSKKVFPDKTASSSFSSAGQKVYSDAFEDLTGCTGSYRFMAPEVYLNKPYGRPVDVYSFALIAFNMLEGRAPWAELAGEKAVRLACQGERPMLPRSYERRIASLLAEAWTHEPVARPSFAAILDMLEAFPADDIERPLDAGASQGCACVIS